MRFHSHKNGTPAFKKEVVRYFFRKDGDQLFKGTNTSGEWVFGEDGKPDWSGLNANDFIDDPRYLEVQESDLPYLKKPDGVWEFRKPKKGDTVMDGYKGPSKNIHHSINVAFRDYRGYNWLSGYRWCKPRKVDAFEEWWNNCDECFPWLATSKEAAREAWNASKEG